METVLYNIFNFWASEQGADARHTGKFEELVKATCEWLQQYNCCCLQSKNKLCVILEKDGSKLFIKPVKNGMKLITENSVRYYPIDNADARDSIDERISRFFVERNYQEDMSFDVLVNFCEEKNYEGSIKKLKKYGKNIHFLYIINYGSIFFNKKSISVIYDDDTKKLFK